jgi:hypothetical protein
MQLIMKLRIIIPRQTIEQCQEESRVKKRVQCGVVVKRDILLKKVIVYDEGRVEAVDGGCWRMIYPF